MSKGVQSKLRVGVIGAGFMGGVHARAITRSGQRIVAVAAATMVEAQSAASMWNADRASTVDDLLDSQDLDVIHVCTPNHLHEEQARRAILAGKHTICEKPLATTTEGARQLTVLANERGVIAAVPFIYRFYGSVREARERIKRGDAGAVRLVHGSYLQDWLTDTTDTNWRIDPRMGGASRAFGDIGIHWCDLVEFISGQRISSLSASLATVVHGRSEAESGSSLAGTEDVASLIFTMNNGATGSLVCSQVSLGRKNRLWLSIDGEHAAYSFDQENPDSLWIGNRNQVTIMPRGSAGQTSEAALYDRTPAGHPQGYQDCFDAFVQDVYSAILGQEPEGLPTFSDGLRAATLVDAVLASATSRSWVEVSI